MADADTTVECPICGGTFDPTAAGGWCTNPDCGEWQYEGDTESETSADEPSEAASDDAADAEAAEATEETAADPAASAPDTADQETADQETDDQETADQETADQETDDQETDEVDAAERPAVDATDAPDEGAEEETGADDDAGEAVETGSVADEADPESDADTDDEDADELATEPATISCPDCGTELDADANFCIECGADVREVEPAEGELTECPSCGTALDGDEHFCANCGEDLDAHREASGSDAESSTGADAVETLAAQTDEDAADAPVTESLVLSVLGTELTVGDGDRIGREVRAALTDAGRSEDEAVRIHREHVRFVREADSFYLVDLGDNPTKLNGRSLQKGDREPVGPGDELELSGVATIGIEAP